LVSEVVVKSDKEKIVDVMSHYLWMTSSEIGEALHGKLARRIVRACLDELEEEQFVERRLRSFSLSERMLGRGVWPVDEFRLTEGGVRHSAKVGPGDRSFAIDETLDPALVVKR
jgi:predicted ArsR family transcriptional regulator